MVALIRAKYIDVVSSWIVFFLLQDHYDFLSGSTIGICDGASNRNPENNVGIVDLLCSMQQRFIGLQPAFPFH
jgi:hypothetical protein